MPKTPLESLIRSGEAAPNFLNQFCAGPGLCFRGFTNIVGGIPLVETEIGRNGPRVQIALVASLAPVFGTGDLDQGPDEVVGTPQFSLLFDAIAPGVTTLFIDTAYQGDGVITPDGSTVEAGGTTFIVNIVPEPGMALLMGLGLTGLAASRRKSIER